MITVLMAAKTSTEYMPHAIGSLLGQSYTDWHLVIGINGLPDSHPAHKEASEHTRAFYSRVTILNLPNCQNKGRALNEMVKHAQGNYVAILDVDDLWHPLKLERQIPFVEMGYDVVGTAGSYFGQHQNSIGVVHGEISRTNFQYGNCIINSSAVIRREHARWEPMNEPLEDYELWLRLVAEERKIFNVGQHLTFVRQHDTNWSKQGKWDDAIKALRQRYG